MEIKAIIYTSNTGHTAQYAKMLGERTGLSVYSLEQAQKSIPSAHPVIYLGWISAGKIKGYKKAARLYDVAAVGGVCMGATGSQLTEVRRANAIPDDVPLFTMRGGLDFKKLRGINRLIIKTVVRGAANNLESKAERSEDERVMLEMMVNGGSYVSEESLTGLLEWYNTSRQ